MCRDRALELVFEFNNSFDSRRGLVKSSIVPSATTVARTWFWRIVSVSRDLDFDELGVNNDRDETPFSTTRFVMSFWRRGSKTLMYRSSSAAKKLPDFTDLGDAENKV